MTRLRITPGFVDIFERFTEAVTRVSQSGKRYSGETKIEQSDRQWFQDTRDLQRRLYNLDTRLIVILRAQHCGLCNVP